MKDEMTIQDELRALAPWHFDVEIAPGVRTTHGNSERYDNPDLQRVRIIDPEEIRPLFQAIEIVGKSFLDIACNAGGYSLLAHKMGASKVFGFDVRDHWIRQANFLRKHLKADSVEFQVMPLDDFVADLKYDVVLFKGIFYHLPDPIHELRKLCSITNEVIIIDTATSNNTPEHCLEAIKENATHVMSGVDGLAWLPGGPEAIKRIVSWLGFPHAHTAYWKETARGRGRTRVVACRNRETLDRVKRSSDHATHCSNKGQTPLTGPSG